MRNQIKLISLKREGGIVDVLFKAISDNGKTTLDQELRLKKDSYGDWTAQMHMEGFNAEKSASDAANKLADWMERMAASIRSHEYDTISLMDL